MQICAHNDDLVLRLYPGQDLYQVLLGLMQERKIAAACMVTCVGSLNPACIRLASAKDYKIIDGPLEIVSLVGTLSSSGLHLHLSVADKGGVVMGGHLQTGSLIHTTAEIVIRIFPGLRFERTHDSITGYKELHIFT